MINFFQVLVLMPAKVPYANSNHGPISLKFRIMVTALRKIVESDNRIVLNLQGFLHRKHENYTKKQ